MDQFVVPRDQVIKDEVDLKLWLNDSVAHKRLWSFLESCNTEIKGKRISQAPPPSPQIERLLSLLDALSALLEEHPPIEQPQRFGNKAFRAYHAALCEKAPALVASMLGPETEAAAMELAPYLMMSFGNPTRLDYGTGHETSFVIMLTCMNQLKLLSSPGDLANIPLRLKRKRGKGKIIHLFFCRFCTGFLIVMFVCAVQFKDVTCLSQLGLMEFGRWMTISSCASCGDLRS